MPTRWPVKRLLLVLALAATAYALAVLWSGGSDRVAWSVLWSPAGLQAGALCLLSYALRGLRWRLWMAHSGRYFGWVEGLRLYAAGFAFTPTPGNVGEALRGLMLTKKPLPLLQSLAIFGAERLADLLCLLLLCLPALVWLWRSTAWLEWQMSATAWLGAAALAVVAGMVTLVVWRNRQQIFKRLGWLQEAWLCLSVRPLVWLGLTLTAWGAQGVAVWLICSALDVHPPMLNVIGFYAVAMVLGALSALPAGLGSMELVLTALLVAQGASTAQALLITVLARLLTLWLAVGIGALALVYSAFVRKDIRLT